MSQTRLDIIVNNIIIVKTSYDYTAVVIVRNCDLPSMKNGELW